MMLFEDAKNIQGNMVDHRRYLHENAEIGFELPKTTEYVMTKLEEMGYKPVQISKSAVVAVAGGKKEGKTFLLRADMDALPMAEETGLPYSSKTGYMHSCGHDMHTAMLLGAAELLKKHEDKIEGQVKLMFQPAEEILGGAKSMVDAGVLENPKVDAAMMIHIFSGMDMPAGTLLVASEGVVSASADKFTIKIQGKGGHGAMPNTAIDPLTVAAHTLIALQEIIAREIAPSETAVLTIGKMQGGDAANIIPDTATLEGTIRAMDNDTRAFIMDRLVEISKSVATTFRATAEVSYDFGTPSVEVDKDVRDKIFEYSTELLGEDKVKNMSEVFPGGVLSGSEDFAYVSEKVPSVMTVLSGGSPDEGYPYPQHHPKVNFNEDVLKIGAAVYANAAIEWLKEHK